jgi:hypothetical protein
MPCYCAFCDKTRDQKIIEEMRHEEERRDDWDDEEEKEESINRSAQILKVRDELSSLKDLLNVCITAILSKDKHDYSNAQLADTIYYYALKHIDEIDKELMKVWEK